MKQALLIKNLRTAIDNQAFLNLLKFYIPFLFILIISGLQNSVSASKLTRDVFTLTGSPPFIGLISNLGVFTWLSSAVICIFSFFLLSPTNHQEQKLKNFIGLSGLISFWFMLDDFFLFHELLFPQLLNIRESLVLKAELIWLISHLIFYRNIVLKSTYFMILGIALLMFGVSLGIDFLPIHVDYGRSTSNWYFLLEDGSKLIGIATWCFYLSTVCAQALLNAKNSSDSQADSA